MAQEGGKAYAPAAFYPQEILLVLISVRGSIMSMKNSNDTIGNESATFGFTAQHFNHSANAVPRENQKPFYVQ